jgi:Tol biopolymer transport system component
VAISDSGILVYLPGRMASGVLGKLVWADREGKEEIIQEVPKAYDDLKISPNGSNVALSITENGNKDIYNYDFDRGTQMRLTFDDANDFGPLWTPDGKRIIFSSDRGGNSNIYWKAEDGSGKDEPIASIQEGNIWASSLSKDGNTLFLVQAGPGGNDIGMLSMEGDRTVQLLLQGEYSEANPRISPDGQWLAYVSDESGQSEVYVRPFPDVESGGKRQVSTSGGYSPLWSPDGHELFYGSSGDVIMSVSMQTEPIFRLGVPQSLFNADSYGNSGWDIHPDGQRFLMIKDTDTTEGNATQAWPRKINIVLNWFEELKERVPVD